MANLVFERSRDDGEIFCFVDYVQGFSDSLSRVAEADFGDVAPHFVELGLKFNW